MNSKTHSPEVLLPVITNLGTDNRVFKMAKSLVNLGYRPVVLCDTPKNIPGPDWTDIEIKIVTRHSHMDNFFRTWINFVFALLPIFLVTKSRVWIVEDCAALFLAAFIGKLRGVQVIYDSHEIFLESPDLKNGRFKRLFWKFWHDGGIHLIKKMIVVSPDTRDYFQQRFKNVEYYVLPNAPFKAGSREEKLALNEPTKEGVTLIYQGYLRRENDLTPLLKSLRAKKEYSIIIIGGGREKENLEKCIRDFKLELQVKMPGVLPFGELAAWTRQGHIGVHLVRSTSLNIDLTWPNKIFDYVHAGLPILMGHTTAMVTFLNIHRVGVMVDPDNEQDILRGINEICLNYSFYKNNCIAAMDTWNWDSNESLLKQFIL